MTQPDSTPETPDAAAARTPSETATDSGPPGAPAQANPLSEVTAISAQNRPFAPPALSGMVSPMLGRRYGFLCAYCSSRLEANDSLAGQSGTCPTCGNAIVIPILNQRGRLIDPTSGQVIKQDPHPVHAYAAAGHRAPQIVPTADGAQRQIQCPRCSRLNPLSANNCLACGLPFTMDGTATDALSGTNTWAVASLVLGIVGIPSFCFVVPSLLAIIFGFIGLRNTRSSSKAGTGMAVAGLILGAIALIAATVVFANMH